jgi:hypothetical protein
MWPAEDLRNAVALSRRSPRSQERSAPRSGVPPSIENGPAVRSASLLEQRGFELPVLFVVPGLCETLEISAGHCAKAEQRIVL